MARIHIRSVLAEIDQPDRHGQAREFSIRYAKKDGSEGFRQRVRKAGIGGGHAPAQTGNFRYGVKKNGVLLIVDCQTNETRALKIRLLTHYNGVQILHG